MYVARILAQNTTSANGQAALARHDAYRDDLTLNEHLTDEVWLALWQQAGARDKEILVGVPLPAHRIDTVLATRRLPKGVLRDVLTRQRLTTTQARRLLDGPLVRDPDMATTWLFGEQYPAEVEAELISRAPSDHYVWELASPHLFDQDRMLEILAGAPAGYEATRLANVALGQPNAGPVVLDAAAALGSEAYIADRLDNFPYAITRPWDQADTDRELALLGEYRERRLPHVTRQRYIALRERHGYTVAASRTNHEAWLATPADNPGTDVLLLTGLTERSGELLARRAARHLEHLLDQAEPGAWDIAATLLADHYPGTVLELATTAATLAPPAGPAHHPALRAPGRRHPGARMSVLTVLARHITSPTGQAAFLARADLRRYLERNEHLTDDTWLALWASSTATGRGALVCVPLPAHRIEYVLAQRRRTQSVLRGLLQHQDLTATQSRVVLARGLDEGHCMAWLQGGRYPREIEADLLAQLAEVNPGAALIRELTSPHLFDQDRMLALLEQAVDLTYLCAQYTVDHPNAGPDVVAAAIRLLDDRYVVHAGPAAAGSDGLVGGKFVVRRGPSLTHAMTRPWDQATTDDELELLTTLVPRRLPYALASRVADWRQRTGVHLPSHDTSHETWLQHSADQPEPYVTQFAPASTASRTTLQMAAGRRLERLLDEAGPGAWDTALTLLTDDYPGTVGELAATAAALSRPAPAARTLARRTAARAAGVTR